jgi:WD40 repeat protein
VKRSSASTLLEFSILVVLILILYRLSVNNTPAPIETPTSIPATHFPPTTVTASPTLTPTATPTSTPYPIGANSEIVPPYKQIPNSQITLEQFKLQHAWGSGNITDLDWSPDGKTIAVAAGDGIYLHNANNLQELSYWRTDTPVTRLAYLSNGWLVAAESSGTIKVWNQTGAAEKTLTGLFETIGLLQLSPDERWLAVTSGADMIMVWDTKTWG